MERKKMLLVEMDGKGIRTEICGDVTGIMSMATEALRVSLKAIEKCPGVSKEDAVNLMGEVVAQYQTEATHGEEAAMVRAMMVFLDHC